MKQHAAPLGGICREFSAVILSGLALLTGTTGCALFTQPPIDPEIQKASDEFVRALYAIKQQGIGNHDYKELTQRALHGMMTSLDPHSDYMDPEAFNKEMESLSGQFGGIGIAIQLNSEKKVEVHDVYEDSPAAQAGLQPGDLIIKVDGTDIDPDGLEQSAELLRGNPDTSVKIVFTRKGVEKPLETTVLRKLVEPGYVTVKTIDTPQGKIGYIGLPTYNSELIAAQMSKAIEHLENNPSGAPFAYIVNERDNLGGLLDQAAKVLALFIDPPEKKSESITLVSVEKKGEKTLYVATHETDANGTSLVDKVGQDDVDGSDVYFFPAKDLIKGKPLVVLTNGYSASASEIFAGTLQDLRRAAIIGTHTYGKGSVQSIIRLSNNPESGGIRLTTALYKTNSGLTPQGNGISPDIKVIEPRELDSQSDPKEISHSNMLKPAENEIRAAEVKDQKVCETKPEALPKAGEAFRVKVTDRKENKKYEIVDPFIACAVDFLTHSETLTVTKPFSAHTP